MDDHLPPTHNAVVVRPLLTVTQQERKKVLEEVGYNVFAFPAGLLTCDYLSDSGTSAMSDAQWAALMRGDESYGRNWGYYCLLDAFRDIFERGENQQRIFQDVVTGNLNAQYFCDKLLFPSEGGFVNGGPHQLSRPNFFIVPQGRCAEALLFSTMNSMLARSNHDAPHVIISNGFFDTTGANAAVAGFELRTFSQPGLNDVFPQHLVGKTNPFKGNLDIKDADKYLSTHSGRVAMILMTITNNWAAAQPVSMANIHDAAALAKRKNIPLFFDACRFAENAYFIKRFEEGYSEKSIAEIVQEMFSYAEGFTISLKKDGLSNMGGVLCFRDEGMLAKKYDGIGFQLKERQILCYGNDSYGGMSGRDLMAAAAGLYEVIKESYLRNRIGQVQYFAQKLQANGIAVLSPPGGHAVYLDMDDFFFGCNRTPGDFASVGFTLELIKDSGIRAAEAGPFGWEWDKKTPEEQAKIPNLVRFAIPRHVLSEEHINFTVQAIKKLHQKRHLIPNVKITRGKDMRLRHFSSALEPVSVSKSISRSYSDEGTRQISLLSQAVGIDTESQSQLLEAFKLAGGEFGQKPIPSVVDHSQWVSDVSNDNTFFEYSVSLDTITGNGELRVLVEAQPEENNFNSVRSSADRLNAQIAERYSSTVSLHRLSLVYDLFAPRLPKGSFLAWYSAVASRKGPQWKIYLDPCASGAENAVSVTREAFKRLDLASSWDMIESILDSNDLVKYFSLDLSPSKEHARVKLYIAHPGATAATVAKKQAQICPDACTYSIQQFCAFMSGGSLGPYESKPLLSCFAFTAKAPTSPVGTTHFPISSYAENDAEIQRRMGLFMDAQNVSESYRDRYRRIVSAVQRRPLDQGRGIHSWISLKQRAPAKSSTTFYLSAELFGPLE